MSIRKYSFTFRVGGPKTGYDVTVEVKARNKKSAAQMIRHRVRKMKDVEAPPQFHYSEVVVGVKVLASEGHDDNGYTKRTRPAPLKFKPEPLPPVARKDAAMRDSHVWWVQRPDDEHPTKVYARGQDAARAKFRNDNRLDKLPRGTEVWPA